MILMLAATNNKFAFKMQERERGIDEERQTEKIERQRKRER